MPRLDEDIRSGISSSWSSPQEHRTAPNPVVEMAVHTTKSLQGVHLTVASLREFLGLINPCPGDAPLDIEIDEKAFTLSASWSNKF